MSRMRLEMAMTPLLLLLLLLLGIAQAAPQDLTIVKADRRVFLTSQFVRSFVSLKIENTGSGPTSEVLFGLPREHVGKLAFMLASSVTSKGKAKGQAAELEVTPVGPSDGAAIYKLNLNKPLEKGQTTSIEIQYVLTHALEPFPVEIKQSDSQLVLHRDTAYLLSPYTVKQQTTIFKVPARIESYTKIDPTRIVDKDKHGERDIKYGPYDNIAPMTASPIKLHFENNSPFAVVKVLEREIEISHWGNIYVTENYHIRHDGARLKGGFSRLDYQSKPGSGASSLRYLEAKLPPRVHSAYYRDEIGNISTSRVQHHRDATAILLEPRYPLFGGWEVPFTLGYGLPLEDFVFATPDGRRYLNFSFGSPVANVVVDKLVIKVVLPEGSSEPEVSHPFSVKVQHETKYSYLDTIGRPVVVLTKRNVVPEHNVVFQVYYKFNRLAMLAEPMMLIVGFFCFFLACMAYLHFDFPISKTSGAYTARIQQEEVLEGVQRLLKVMKRRLYEVEKLESALRDLSRTGDAAACKAARKSADPLFKETAKDVKTIVESLQSRSASVTAKVDNLVTKEKEKLDKLLQKLSLAVDMYDKKVSGKEIDSRLAPHEQKYAQLKQEVADALSGLED